jgi:hypothetical protein
VRLEHLMFLMNLLRLVRLERLMCQMRLHKKYH